MFILLFAILFVVTSNSFVDAARLTQEQLKELLNIQETCPKDEQLTKICTFFNCPDDQAKWDDHLKKARNSIHPDNYQDKEMIGLATKAFQLVDELRNLHATKRNNLSGSLYSAPTNPYSPTGQTYNNSNPSYPYNNNNYYNGYNPDPTNNDYNPYSNGYNPNDNNNVYNPYSNGYNPNNNKDYNPYSNGYNPNNNKDYNPYNAAAILVHNTPPNEHNGLVAFDH